jgi:DNA-binding transcriptional MerR regulator
VKQASTRYTLEELSSLSGLPVRTVRYYIQQGLVPRPTGTTRNAAYATPHLEALLRIAHWSAAGLSLARISELLTTPAAVSELPKTAGSVEVCSHIHLQDGVELVIAPDRAQLRPEQIRELTRVVLNALAALRVADPLTHRRAES